jgi:hypothetical protein
MCSLRVVVPTTTLSVLSANAGPAKMSAIFYSYEALFRHIDGIFRVMLLAANLKLSGKRL